MGQKKIGDSSIEVVIPTIQAFVKNNRLGEDFGTKFQNTNFNEIDEQINELKTETLSKFKHRDIHHGTHYALIGFIIVVLLIVIKTSFKIIHTRLS